MLALFEEEEDELGADEIMLPRGLNCKDSRFACKPCRIIFSKSGEPRISIVRELREQ